MDIKELTEQIINGRRLTREDDLSFLLKSELNELAECADKLRRHFSGSIADLCSIINGRSGRCPEDCKFCAQSAHHCTGIEEYSFLEKQKIAAECRHNEEQGVDRFAIVTAGRKLSGDEFDKALDTYRTLASERNVRLCASFGLLEEEQFTKLRQAGVTRYHANIETSRANFGNICTTHTFEDKLECIRRARAAGLEVCSGGIIGMGESWQDRIDMALTLSELGVSSIPINALIPIKGTPLENIERITEPDILRTVAIFRFIVPQADIRLAAGRNLMTNCGEQAFLSGANSAITGDMLTTSGNRIREDIAMLDKIGYTAGRNKKHNGIFVTGTGTDIGKTFVTALLVKKLREIGCDAAYFKAAVSGNERDENGRLVPGDAAYVKKISGSDQPLDTMCPYIYETAVSPHLAARIEGDPVELSAVKRQYEKLCGEYGYIVCEGSGGIVCPIRYDDEKIMLEDIIKAVGLPTLIIADAGLGTINSVVLTCEYMKAHGLEIRGLILNNFHKGNVMEEDNKLMCEKLTGVPVIACVGENDTDIDIPKDVLVRICKAGGKL